MKAFIDLHCHTISSGHAYSTMKENIDSAAEKGLKYLGVSDHAMGMPGSPHIFHFNNLRAIPNDIKGVRILRGIEGNITNYTGDIDVPKDLAEELDYVIASMHPPCVAFGTIEENTKAVLGAMANPYVKIIAHPDDSRYPLDYEAIVKGAKEHNVLLELNNSSLRPNGYRQGAWENGRKMLELCKEHEVRVILGSDAHICYDIAEFSNCENLLSQCNFPDKLVINYNESDIKDFFNI